MSLEHEPSSIEADLEKFSVDLEDAGNFAKEFGARTPLDNLPSFDALIGDETAMLDALMQKFGVNLHTDQPIKEYSIDGVPGSRSEGAIEVMVFATNDPEVFLGRYTGAQGDIDWAIRPLVFEEE